MKNAIYINAHGLVSIYEILEDKDIILKNLEEYKNKKIDDFIELISTLSEAKKIKLSLDSDLELKPEEYSREYNFYFTKKFI